MKALKICGHPPGAVQTLCAVPASRDRMRANLRNRYGGQHQLSKIDVPYGPEADRC